MKPLDFRVIFLEIFAYVMNLSKIIQMKFQMCDFKRNKICLGFSFGTYFLTHPYVNILDILSLVKMERRQS